MPWRGGNFAHLAMSAMFFFLPMRYCFFFMLLMAGAVQSLEAQPKSNKTTRIYFESGELQMLIYYDAGCQCKTYSEYYMDGKVFAKRTFKVTDRSEYVDGEEVSYYNDGVIKTYKMWKEAIPVGRAYANYENGKLEHEEFYDDRYRSGTWKYYNKKGELVKEQVYEPHKTLWNSKKLTVTNKYYSGNKIAYTETLSSGRGGQTVVNDKAAFYKKTLSDSLSGKTLYELRCSACHKPDKDGYGPALAGITKKRSEKWLETWIKDGYRMVEAGDEEAIKLYKKKAFKHLPNDRLSAKQIKAIIEYVKGFKK
jgi:mono/diheme cytochrome c family protein